MKIVKYSHVPEWLNWLEIDAATLVAEERDIRATLRSGDYYFGSLAHVSSTFGILALETYGEPATRISIDVIDLAQLEVFDSRRLRPDRAYRQMREMEGIVINLSDIEDSCP